MDPITMTAAKELGGKLWGMIGIKGLISIGLAIALGIVMWRADVISGQRDDLRNKYAGEVARHEITRNSVDTLEQALGMYVGAGQAARLKQLAAIEAQEEISAELQRQADEIRAQLEAGPPESDCKCATPGIILRSDGL